MIDESIRHKYKATIGVECHVQFKTKTKLFSAVDNDARNAAPNTLVSHICFGLPGALPVLNEKVIELATKAAFALNTKPQKYSQFDRKNYFYPDLPKGYQITQYHYPVIADGFVDIIVDSEEKRINITRAHLEEDAGKSVHPTGKDYSLIDLNRAGTPLLEIVSEPEMHTAAEVKAYAKELFLAMKYADVSDANLYYGNMRFDVNVSVSQDPKTLGTRSETKNLNSFRSVEKAVDYEINRQIEMLEKGERIAQETRGWNDAKQKTFSQRSKEDEHDYRYFPEPDVPPVNLEDSFIENIKKVMLPLPNFVRSELKTIGLGLNDIETLLVADSSNMGQGYIAIIRNLASQPDVAKYAANWMINRRIAQVQKQEDELTDDTKIKLPTAEQINDVYKLQVNENKLSSNNADQLLSEIAGKKELAVTKFAEDKGYLQVSDESAIEEIIERIIKDNPQAVSDIKNGEIKAVGFLVGQVMKASQGKVNPGLAEKLIRKNLETK